MSDIKQLIEWCQEARRILKETGSKRGSAAEDFTKALKNVAALLRQITALAGELTIVRQAESMLQRIAEDANALKSYEGDDKREKAKKITERLEALAKGIRQNKSVAENVNKYRALLSKCQYERADLATYPYPFLNDVDKVIADATRDLTALDSPSEVEKALKVLGGFEKKKKEAVDKQKKNATEAEKQVKAQPSCLDRLNEVNRVLDYARREGVGVDSEIKLLEQAVKSAGNPISSGKWLAALEILNTSKPTALPTREQIQLKSKKSLDRLPPQAVQAQKALAEFKLLVDDTLYSDAALSLNTHLREAVADPPKAQRLMEDTLSVMQDRVAEAKRLGLDAVRLRDAIVAQRNKASADLTDSDLFYLKDQIDLLNSDIDQKRVLRAVDQGTSLLDEVTKLSSDAKEAREKWVQVEGHYTELIEELRELANDPVATEDAKADCTLRADAAERLRGPLVSARDWNVLLAQYESLLQQPLKFEKAKQDFDGFAEQREQAKSEMANEFHATGELLESARIALKGGKDELSENEKGIFDSLEERFKGAQDAWDKTLANATDEVRLNALGTSEELAKLAKEMLAVSSPKGVDEVRFKDRFEEEANGLESLFTQLDDIDTAWSQTYREQLAKLRADGATWEVRLGALPDLKESMELHLSREREEGDKRSLKLIERCSSLSVRMNTQQKKLKSTKDKTFAPLFEDLIGQLADQKAMSTTPNASAHDSIISSLDELERQIRGIEAMSSSGSAFELVRKELDKLDEAIKEAKSDLQKNLPKRLESLQKMTTELHSTILSLTPEDAINEINAVRISVNQARTQAKDVEALRTSFNQLKPVVEASIKKLGELKIVSALVEVFGKRLSGAVTLAKNPEKLFTAKQQLDELRRDVEEAFVQPEKGREMQTKVLAEAERQRLLKVQCESELANVKKVGLKRARDAVKQASGDKALVAEIERMIDDTADIVKSKDYAEGVRKLALVQKRIEEVVADPQGPGIGSRKSLPKDAELFAASADKLIKSLDPIKFVEMAGSRFAGLKPPLDLPEALASKLRMQIEQLMRRIKPVLFEDFAKRLSDSKQPARDLREVRESALQVVRDTRAMLTEHPQFAALWECPFYVELRVNKTELEQRLLRLEANIRRSVN